MGGLIFNTRTILLALIAIELMFFGANYLLVLFSVALDDIFGAVFALYVVCLAAGERQAAGASRRC
jgi:NADH:ubiquinone oxidoreductase subunit K